MKLGWIVKLHFSHLFFSKIVLNLFLTMHNKGVLIDLSMLVPLIDSDSAAVEMNHHGHQKAKYISE